MEAALCEFAALASGFAGMADDGLLGEVARTRIKEVQHYCDARQQSEPEAGATIFSATQISAATSSNIRTTGGTQHPEPTGFPKPPGENGNPGSK
jgi:hypothetical protein